MDSENSNLETIKTLSQILLQYQWLLNAYNVDYYLENHWQRLPQKWKVSLENVKTTDIPSLLCPSQSTKFMFPLSLLCLRKLSSMIRSLRSMKEEMPIFKSPKMDSQNLPKSHNLTFSFTKNHQPLNTIDHILCRKVKLKKRHEIDRLCQLIPRVMKNCNDCRDIVDCGSGHGHLDRILTLLHGYRVFSIEANGDFVNGALNQDDKVLKALRRFQFSPKAIDFNWKEENQCPMPTKVNCYLSDQTPIGPLVDHQGKYLGNHLLLGLHACGALSNLIMEQFANNPNSMCLVLACCCYMKAGLDKFPMSKFVKENLQFELSIEAKELACHATEKFLSKFNSQEPVLDSLKVHGYRACLEFLINKFCPEKRHTAMRSVRISQQTSFKEYGLKATRDLNLQIPNEIYESEFVQPLLNEIDQVVLFYSLRLLIAPIVELFILMDYQQYLNERQDVKATYLIPLFEPTLSPRNLILIAHK